MSNINIKLTTKLVSVGFFAIVLALVWQITPASAAEKCTFTRDLEVGVDGEDVRCLQKYLNSAGFKIASTGPGAPGGETTLFRDGTKAAVIKWQTANGVSPATGYFGPLSKSKYNQVVGGTTTTTLVQLTLIVTPFLLASKSCSKVAEIPTPLQLPAAKVQPRRLSRTP